MKRRIMADERIGARVPQTTYHISASFAGMGSQVQPTFEICFSHKSGRAVLEPTTHQGTGFCQWLIKNKPTTNLPINSFRRNHRVTEWGFNALAESYARYIIERAELTKGRQDR